jgi:O-antigen/teichoic acid export membrane protein
MLFWEILGFSGWSLWGSVATMSATQGVNMLLNMFFGVTVNAAMGIASQVAGGLNGFVSNFQMAYRPQIVKSFAKCERGILLDMIFTSARMSVLLLFLFAAPVIMNMRFVLALWLKVVPTYAPIFCQVILACALLESLSAPMWMTIQATGRIRCYQLYISAALGLNIVLSYIFLRQGYPPATVLYIRLGIYALCLLIRLQFMRVLVDFPVFEFGTQVVARVVVVMGLSIIAPMLVCYHAAGWTRFCLSILVFGVGYAPAAFWLGLKEDERTLAMSALRTMAGSNSPPPLCS